MVELEDLMDEYFERFGDCFPTIPLAWGRPKEEVKSMIETCLKENKDVYDMGYLTLKGEEY